MLAGCSPKPMPSNSTNPTSSAEVEVEPAVEVQPSGDNAQFLAQVNALRKSGCTCGDGQRMPAVSPLQWNSKLESAARRHARDMAKNDHFDHTGTDRSTMDGRVADAGYRWRTVAENIAVSSRAIPEVVEQWRKSTHGHCQNMMAAEHSEMAAVWEDGPNDRYWAMVLASR